MTLSKDDEQAVVDEVTKLADALPNVTKAMFIEQAHCTVAERICQKYNVDWSKVGVDDYVLPKECCGVAWAVESGPKTLSDSILLLLYILKIKKFSHALPIIRSSDSLKLSSSSSSPSMFSVDQRCRHTAAAAAQRANAGCFSARTHTGCFSARIHNY